MTGNRLAVTSRSGGLDSLRGLAATLVVVTHFLAATYPAAVFGTAATGWQFWLLLPPGSLLTAAHFAVCLFFVLSGYVLSIGLVGRRDARVRLIGAIVKRPVRLGGTLVFSLIVAALLINGGLLRHVEASAVSGSTEWFARFWAIDFQWRAFFLDLVSARAGSEYNPPLWTLRIELVGSFLVFGVMLVSNSLPLRVRFFMYALLLMLTWGSFYDGFIIGIWLADTRRNTRFGTFALHPAHAHFLIVPALLLAAFPHYAVPYWSARLGLVAPAVLHQIPMLAAGLCFVVVLVSPALLDNLDRPWLRALGKQSYALYVLHFLLLGSISAYLLIQLTPTVGYVAAVLVTALVSAVALAVCSVFVTHWIDRPSIALASTIDSRVQKWLTRSHTIATVP